METTQANGDTDPWAKDEGGALIEHNVIEVEGCHRILSTIVGESLYRVRQLSVFYHQAHRGIPTRC